MDVDTAILAVLETQANLNDTVARALESLALQADRYDAEITALRAELAQLRGQLARHEAWLSLLPLKPVPGFTERSAG